MMSAVAVRKVNADALKVISEETERFKIEFERYDCISIKPNLCCYRGWETGATTSPILVEDLIRVIKDYNNKAKICIVESDTWVVNANLAFALLGYKKIEEKYKGVVLVNLSNDEIEKIQPDGYYFKEFNAPKALIQSDFFITFPKLKTAAVDVITCALKNQYGCNPDSRKEKYHKQLSKVIVDLNKIFKPDFCVVDGIIAMDITGPSNGRPRRCNVLVFGNDVVSIDAEVMKLTGLERFKCRHLELATKAGLGRRKGYERFGDNLKFNFSFSRWRHYKLKFDLFFKELKR